MTTQANLNFALISRSGEKTVKVIVAGSSISSKLLREAFLDAAPNVDRALAAAFKLMGKDAKVLVIPHSLLTILMVS